MVSLLLLTSCAVVQEIAIDDYDDKNGELVIQFSDNIKNVRATLDDRLIRTESGLTKELILYDIHPGKYTLHVSAASWELRDDLNYINDVTIREGQQSAVIVSVPPKSGGYWAVQAVIMGVSLYTSLYLVNRR